MAKEKVVEQTEEVQTDSNKKVNLVTMADGSVKNFGERGRLLSSKELTDSSFSLTFHIQDGSQVIYTFAGSTELLLEMAAFGAEAKVKAATAGVAVADLQEVITSKIAEFNDGNFVGRTTGEMVNALSQIQIAYATVNNIDVSAPEGVAKVNAIFRAMTKEDKSNLYKVAKIQVELAKLKLAAAEAALGLEDKVETQS